LSFNGPLNFGVGVKEEVGEVRRFEVTDQPRLYKYSFLIFGFITLTHANALYEIF